MRSPIFKTTLLTIIISSLILSPLEGVFVNRIRVAEAQTTFGEAVGKAVAAGVACFAAIKLENFAKGFIEKKLKVKTENPAEMKLHAYAVPTVTVNFPSETAKKQTSDALMKSKDCVRDVIAKILLDWIVDETLVWIQGGGSPKFVTNWGDFLRDAVNVGVGEVVKESNFNFLCAPFRAQMRLSLLGYQPFQERIECTLDDVVANIEDFYRDFEMGGWIAYREIWQPQNNYYGQMLMFYDEMVTRAAAAKEAAQNEALAGRGFLSVKRCILRDGSTGKCLKEEIVTPGDIVGEVAGEAMTSDITWAANIKSWVAALTNAVISRLVKDGLMSMTRRFRPQQRPPADYGNFDPYLGSDYLSGDRKTAVDYIISQYEDYLNGLKRLLGLKNQALSYVQRALEVATTIKQNYSGCLLEGRFYQYVERDNEGNVTKDYNLQIHLETSFIPNRQKRESELKADIANLQGVINEIEANLKEAKDYKDEQEKFPLIQEKYERFVDSGGDFIMEAHPAFIEDTVGSYRREVDQERRMLEMVDFWLDLCDG